jgi:hypothetical protein
VPTEVMGVTRPVIFLVFSPFFLRIGTVGPPAGHDPCVIPVMGAVPMTMGRIFPLIAAVTNQELTMTQQQNPQTQTNNPNQQGNKPAPQGQPQQQNDHTRQPGQQQDQKNPSVQPGQPGQQEQPGQKK